MLPVMRFRENQNGPVLFEQAFATEAQYEEVAGLCINQRPIDSPDFGFRTNTCKNFWTDFNRPISTKPFIFVTRTNTCKNFCEDFFLPGLMSALKTQDLAGKLIALLICFVLGLSTLPIRCITLIPRYIQNRANRKENHPLHKYLAENGADPSLLNCDSIYVESRRITNIRNQNCTVHRSGKILRFIELPAGEGDPYGHLDNIQNIPLNQLHLV